MLTSSGESAKPFHSAGKPLPPLASARRLTASAVSGGSRPSGGSTTIDAGLGRAFGAGGACCLPFPLPPRPADPGSAFCNGIIPVVGQWPCRSGSPQGVLGGTYGVVDALVLFGVGAGAWPAIPEAPSDNSATAAASVLVTAKIRWLI